ncbi:MAG: pyridoxamine 5'-phosphate oxidase family protein, partial [Cystobacter sp.]
DRARVRRVPDRGRYDRATLDAIIDAAHLCHLAFADERGVHCIPMACWREADHLYVHGSNASQLIKQAASGAQVCVTITHLDGLVLARSAFHHSMNYRSAVIHGVCERVAEEDKAAALEVFLEKIAPGRSREARPPNAKELGATTVLRLPLVEFACKVREGGPKDDAEDMALPVWAGVLPLELAPRAPIAEGGTHPTPRYIEDWHDGRPPPRR